MRKKTLILLAFIIFLYPFMENQQTVNAATGKVVNQGAKKIAKEVIKGVAVDMSFNMVMDYKWEGKKAKEGFETICLPKDRNGSDCTKPMQIKKMTPTDKKNLGKTVEKNLEKKIAGGIGATRWGKFLDWILPIFAIGFGFTVMDYIINGDVSDLFDELAWESLIEDGFLIDSNEVTENEYFSNIEWDYAHHQFSSIQLHAKRIPDDMIIFYYRDGVRYRNSAKFLRISITMPYGPTGDIRSLDVYVNDTMRVSIDIRDKNIPGIPRVGDGTNMPIGDVLPILSIAGVDGILGLEPLDIREVPSLPDFSETELPRTYPSKKPIKVPAPGSLPLETTTGTKVEPFRKNDGSIGYRTKTDGKEVQEDDVIVLDPDIEHHEDGSSTIKAPSTPINPDPEPEIIPPTTPPGTDLDLPDFPGEDGKSCDAELKLPRFTALLRGFSDAFPFSIPWDLKNGFDAVFENINSDGERPSFEYKTNFNNKEHNWRIEIPDYIDSWMPFIRSVLLITFDIGIMYGIYRFVKGGGS